MNEPAQEAEAQETPPAAPVRADPRVRPGPNTQETEAREAPPAAPVRADPRVRPGPNTQEAEAREAPPAAPVRADPRVRPGPRPGPLLCGAATLIFALLALKNAWIADDAGLTLRTVDNLLNGYGPTWNITERVQAYTHPLWMLVLALSAAFTREYLFTTFAVSLSAGIGAVVALWRGSASSIAGSILALTILSLSQAFIDYSTSGLENPLAHLLLALFCLSYLRNSLVPRTLAWLSLSAGLLALNRLDHALLVAPAMAGLAFSLLVRPADPAVRRSNLLVRLRSPAFLALFAGVLPLLIWHTFALFYYGFPFPNTAYAKLNTGIPSAELARQGVLYLLDSLRNDPLTLTAIIGGAALPLVRRDWRATALSLGIALYLLYIVRIGGDFMSGRFLTAPLFLACVLLARLLPAAPYAYAVVGVAALIGLFAPRSPLTAPLFAADAPNPIVNGIADERRIYFATAGLVNLNRDLTVTNTFAERFRPELVQHAVAPWGSVGLLGLQAGPQVHLVDVAALADPLLARLPAAYDPNWRIGHFRRIIPDGYLLTLETGTNQLTDPNLAAYYEHLRLAVRGDLLDPQRLAAIWALNRGVYDHLIDRDRYRYPDAVQRTLADDAWPRPGQAIPVGGMLIDLTERATAERIEIELGPLDRYRLILLRDRRPVYQHDLPVTASPFAPLATLRVAVPPSIAAAGYDQIRVLPRSTLAPQVGAVRLLGPADPSTPQFFLGGGWAPPEADLRSVRSPATIIIDAATPGRYRLSFTPTAIYDPASPTGFGERGEVTIRAGADPTVTTIQRDQPFAVEFDLPAGRQFVTLELSAGAFRPPVFDERFPSIDMISFQVRDLRLEAQPE